MKAIKNQFDPHFTFNAINAIGSVVLKKDEPSKVYDYLSKVSNFIRKTVQQSDKVAITLNEELEFIQNYIDLQKLTLENELVFKINIDEEVDIQTLIPKMFIYHYIENAIKHGIRRISKTGILSLEIKKVKRQLHITIMDNGPGYLYKSPMSENSTGKGENINNQIHKLFEKLYKKQIQTSIEEIINENGSISGTKVKIEISL